MTTTMTDIYVFVDTFWPYRWIVNYVVYVLQGLNIHPYASSVTVLSASDGSIIVNRTNYITDLYQQWNITTHSWYKPGFNLPRILNTIRDQVDHLLQAESVQDALGGHSLVALIVPSAVSYIEEYDFNYCKRFVDYLNYTLPSLHFIYYTGGAVIRFRDFVDDPSRDLFALDMNFPPEIIGTPVVERIRQIPRRISNPRCTTDGAITVLGDNTLTQYARPGSINFYRLDSQYFQGWKTMRYLKIKPISQIAFTVCTSRVLALPYRNASQPTRAEETCEQTTTGDFSYDLTDACLGYDFIPCPPLFFSVQSQAFGDVSCTNAACQTPDQAQYSIYFNNLGCQNVATRETLQLWIFSLLLLMLKTLSI